MIADGGGTRAVRSSCRICGSRCTGGQACAARSRRGDRVRRGGPLLRNHATTRTGIPSDQPGRPASLHRPRRALRARRPKRPWAYLHTIDDAAAQPSLPGRTVSLLEAVKQAPSRVAISPQLLADGSRAAGPNSEECGPEAQLGLREPHLSRLLGTAIVPPVQLRFALVEFPADDPERARRFWSGLLGAELESRSGEEGSGWQTHSDAPVVGVHQRGTGPGDTVSLPYFTVADLGVALERVRTLGGSVIHPGSHWAICRDSEGSPFGLALDPSART